MPPIATLAPPRTPAPALALRTVYQPIADIATGRPVAFEALVRGPAGSPLESPGALFGAARRHGLLVELDERCRESAVLGAHAAGLRTPLFVNVEPDALRAGGVEPLRRLVATWGSSAHLVLEITERALTQRPSELLYFIAAARRLGLRIALDDVGVDPRSLALMPLVAPDVIKLDMRLVHEPPSAHTAAVVTAVAAECERSGALLLAEGIEHEEHHRRARALGATLVQGWHLGRPGPLPRDVESSPLPALPLPPAPAPTPFAAVAPHRPTRQADWRFLLQISHLLEDRARGLGAEAVVLGAFQSARRFTDDTARRYRALAESAALVAAFGVDLDPEPVEGVRGADLRPDDPLGGEWSVVVLGPHFAGALVARETTHRVRGSRVFEYAVTHDRPLVVAAARALMTKVLPQEGGDAAAPSVLTPARVAASGT